MDAVNNIRWSASSVQSTNQPPAPAVAASQPQADQASNTPAGDAITSPPPATSQRDVFAAANQTIQQNAPLPRGHLLAAQVAEVESQLAFSAQPSANDTVAATNDEVAGTAVDQTTSDVNFNALQSGDIEVDNELRTAARAILDEVGEDANASNQRRTKDEDVDMILEIIAENLSLMNTDDGTSGENDMIETINSDLVIAVEDDDAFEALPEVTVSKLYRLIDLIAPKLAEQQNESNQPPS